MNRRDFIIGSAGAFFIALDTCEPVVLDPRTGALQSRAAAQRWSREYEKGWELA